MEPTVLDDFPNLKSFHARVQALPAIAAYIQSDEFILSPLNGRSAVWGGN